MAKQLGLTLLAIPTFTTLFTAMIALLPSASPAYAASALPTSRFILTDHILARKLKLEPLALHESTDTVLVNLTEKQRDELAHAAHDLNRCGGHELLTALPIGASVGQARELANTAFRAFDEQSAKDLRYKSGVGIPTTPPTTPSVPNAAISAAIAEVSESNLKDTVDFLSKFPTRNHKSTDAKTAILAFKSRIEDTLKGSTIPYTIDLIAHTSTPMNSIRLTFIGAKSPNEVVVAGGHIDSINQSYFGSKSAPGSDDNASGSANILETARILSHGSQPNRSIEFYWYAGEEGGLLGSAEIAAAAKKAGKNVVGVLQLDMTLFPGDGEFKLGSMTDFTSLEMRDLLSTINRDYLNVTIIEDKCGYGCSDHASWYKNGFPTLMPFEATMKKMNGTIHSEKDVVSASSSFRHSAMFSKIAVAFLMTLSQQ